MKVVARLLKYFFLLTLIGFFIPDSTATEHISNPREYIIHHIDSLNQLATEVYAQDLELAKSLADRALKLAVKIQYQKGSAESSYIIGVYETRRENFYLALENYLSFLRYFQSINDNSKIELACVRISSLYLEISNFEYSLNYCNKALMFAERSGSAYDLALAYFGYAAYYYKTGEIQLALNKLDSALIYGEQSKDIELNARITKLHGDLYIETNHLSESYNYYLQALQNFHQLGNLAEEAIILTRLAHISQLQNKFDNTLRFSKEALTLREKQVNLELTSYALINIGTAFLYLQLADSALPYYQRGLEFALQTKNNIAIENAYSHLFNFHKKRGNDPLALTYLELYAKTHDSVNIERNSSRLHTLELDYLKHENESQIQLLENEIEIQRLELENRSYSEFISQMALTLVFLVVIFFFYLRERSNRAQERLIEINTQLDKEAQERKLSETNLRKSEQLYRFVTEHTLDLIVRMDRNFHYLYVSPSIHKMFGYEVDAEASFPELSKLIDPGYYDELLMEYRGMIRSKKPILLTHKSLRKDGSSFWAESLVNPIFDEENGKLKETITVIRDISDRVAYENALTENAEQKELLLREIHHRVKNNFAILISLMNMQKVSSDPRDFHSFLNDLQGRIRTMSLVHELLYRSPNIDYIDFKDYLNQLVGIISSAFHNLPVNIDASYSECVLDVETALPLGLISNEILTNAYKYAFSDRSGGELSVVLSAIEKGVDDDIAYSHQLIIHDNGLGLPEGFQLEDQKSMGSQIITLLVDQIDGKLHYSNDHGAKFTILFSDERGS